LRDASKAGCSLVTIMVANLDATAEAITGRGIEPTKLEDYGEARMYVFHEPRRQRERRGRRSGEGDELSRSSTRKSGPSSASRDDG
jgi:hypothetical protein